MCLRSPLFYYIKRNDNFCSELMGKSTHWMISSYISSFIDSKLCIYINIHDAKHLTCYNYIDTSMYIARLIGQAPWVLTHSFNNRAKNLNPYPVITMRDSSSWVSPSPIYCPPMCTVVDHSNFNPNRFRAFLKDCISIALYQYCC